MRHDYNQDVFEELTGKTVDKLWKEYRDQLKGGDSTAAPAMPTHGASRRDRLKEKLGGSKTFAEEAAKI